MPDPSEQSSPDEQKWNREHDQILREMIRHEDGLRDNRLGYLLTFNAFLFAGLAFAWNKSLLLVILLSLVGVAVGASAQAGQVTSDKAITRLRKMAEHADPPVVGFTSHLNGDYALNCATKMFQPWKALPWILIVAWPVILIVRLATEVVRWLLCHL